MTTYSRITIPFSNTPASIQLAHNQTYRTYHAYHGYHAYHTAGNYHAYHTYHAEPSKMSS